MSRFIYTNLYKDLFKFWTFFCSFILSYNLPEDAIKSTTLTFFSDFSRKRASPNKLNYKDKKIVDLLKEFYRVEEVILPNDFWEKNYEVMKATNEIFKATSEILRIFLQKE